MCPLPLGLTLKLQNTCIYLLDLASDGFHYHTAYQQKNRDQKKC